MSKKLDQLPPRPLPDPETWPRSAISAIRFPLYRLAVNEPRDGLRDVASFVKFGGDSKLWKDWEAKVSGHRVQIMSGKHQRIISVPLAHCVIEYMPTCECGKFYVDGICMDPGCLKPQLPPCTKAEISKALHG